MIKFKIYYEIKLRKGKYDIVVELNLLVSNWVNTYTIITFKFAFLLKYTDEE